MLFTKWLNLKRIRSRRFEREIIFHIWNYNAKERIKDINMYLLFFSCFRKRADFMDLVESKLADWSKFENRGVLR